MFPSHRRDPGGVALTGVVKIFGGIFGGMSKNPYIWSSETSIKLTQISDTQVSTNQT